MNYIPYLYRPSALPVRPKLPTDPIPSGGAGGFGDDQVG